MTRIITYLYLLLASINFPILDSKTLASTTNTSIIIIDIPLNLSAKDKRSNIQLQPKFNVVSVTDGKVIPLKEVDGRFTVMVKSGESYKITAYLDGYHTKEKIQNIATDQDKEGFNVILDMEPQPSATLILKALDNTTGDYVDATFTITAGDKTYTGKTGEELPYYRLLITKAGLYTVEVTTNTHKPKRESFALEIGDPARSYNKDIRLEKPTSGVKILIVGDDTQKALKGVSLKITNTTDNVLFFDNLLPEGEAVVELDPAKRYSASIEQPDYTPLKLDLKATSQKELVLTMPSESFFSFGAYDRFSGKRLPATFKISYRENTQEIKGTVDGDIKFKPTEGGIYTVEVSHPNYTTKKEPFNLENLSAGKLSHKIMLESTVDEYVILVVDGEDKQMIQGADVKIFDDLKQPVPVKLNAKTGEYKIVLEKNKDYFLQVEVNGYMKQTSSLQRSTSKLIISNMQKVFQTVFYSAIDGITKKPIEAKYKLMRSDQEIMIGTSDATTQYKVDLFPQKNYILEISADGYKTITENPGFAARKTEKDGIKVIELQKDAYTFAFKVLDAQKKQAISNAKLSIMNLSTNQPIGTTNDKNIFTVNLPIAGNYSVTVEAEGYEKSSQNIDAKALASNRQFEQEVPLFKNAFDKIKLMVQDENNGGNVANANLRVFNSNNEPIAIVANPLSAEWLAELKNDESYSVEIKADGYVPYKGSLPENPSNKTVKLKIKKVPTEEISFAPIDALTKKGIVSEFKITTGGEVINGTLLQGGTRMKATLAQDKSYEIELSPSGYKTYKDVVNFSLATNGVITIPLKKESYGFNFKALDSKNKQPIPNVKLKLTDDANQIVTAKFAIETQYFQVNLIPDKKYNVEIEAPGYEVYAENVDVTNLASTSDFKRDMFMIKKEVEKKAEPKPELKKEEPKPEPKKEEPKPEPKKEEPKPEPKKEEPKPEPKKEEPKPEPKKEEPKPEPKKEEPKPEPKKEEPKPEPKKEEPKPEPKKEEPKIVERKPEQVKPIEKKIEVAVTTPETLIDKKPKPAPKKVETKEEKTYVDKATVITDEDFNVKVEIFENLGVGKRFRLSNLYFEQSSSKIKTQSFPQLDKLVNTMKLNPKVKLEIVGYTDNNGDPRQNLALSHFRATVVSNYLFNKGIAANRIKAVGKGQDEPIAPNDTEDNRTKNRRVEFVITEN